MHTKNQATKRLATRCSSVVKWQGGFHPSPGSSSGNRAGG
jgi:hypothetical protein